MALEDCLLAVVLLWNSGLIQDYQKTRITSFMNPDTDTSDSGYHLRQSLIGIGSGGFFGAHNSYSNDGTGGFASQYVPEVETDFIFAQIGEQWGTVGAIILLSLYGILISRMINIAKNSKDIFGKVCLRWNGGIFLICHIPKYWNDHRSYANNRNNSSTCKLWRKFAVNNNSFLRDCFKYRNE